MRSSIAFSCFSDSHEDSDTSSLFPPSASDPSFPILVFHFSFSKFATVSFGLLIHIFFTLNFYVVLFSFPFSFSTASDRRFVEASRCNNGKAGFGFGTLNHNHQLIWLEVESEKEKQSLLL